MTVGKKRKTARCFSGSQLGGGGIDLRVSAETVASFLRGEVCASSTASMEVGHSVGSQPDYDFTVSFSFVTPRHILTCPHPKRSAEQRAAHDSTATVEAELPRTVRTTTVKLLHTQTESAQLFSFEYDADDRMSSVYRALYQRCSDAGPLVCYAPLLTQGLLSIGLGVDHVLTDRDPIPPIVFCQELAYPRPLEESSPWTVVSILVLTPQGDLAPAHVPLLAATRDLLNVDAVYDHVKRLCGTSTAETHFLRGCPVVRCCLSGRSILVEEPFDSAAPSPHIAVVYPAAEVGDVVAVREKGSPQPPRQGVVLRRRVSDAVVLYDVQELITATVLTGVLCTRVIPL